MPRPWFNNGLMIGKGAAAPEPSSIPALTNGQIPIGSTGYPPVPATITGGGGLVVTGGAGTLALTTRGFVSTVQGGTVGGGEDTLQTWSMPANTGVVHGGVHISALVGFAGNGNTKTLRFYVGGSATILNPTTAAPNNLFAVVDLWAWYQTTTTAILHGTVLLSDRTTEAVIAAAVSTTIDWTATMVLKFTGAGTLDNDVVVYDAAMLAFRTP